MDKKDQKLYMAKLCEQAERYEDMAQEMSEFVKLKSKENLTTEERNLLSVAYKNVVGAKRSAHRVYSSMLHSSSIGEKQQTLLKGCLEEIKKELSEKCMEVIKLINGNLIKNTSDEPEVFYMKMMGDYYRYLAEAEISEEENRKESFKCYETAMSRAEHMAPTDPVKLGLALNYSVFLYEIEKNQSKACETAKAAFDEAMEKLDQLTEDDCKDTVLIVQLLRDNLTLWTSEEDTEQQAD